MKSAEFYSLIIFVSLTCPAFCLLDQDSDGMSDVWEEQSGFSPASSTIPEQLPNADPDGDGVTNLEESIAGTDPLRGSPPHGFFHLTAAPSSTEPLATQLQWQQFYGKSYQLQSSPSLEVNSWTPLGSATTAIADGITSYITPQRTTSSTREFYRAFVQNVDSDEDDLTNAEEFHYSTDPNSPDSDADGTLDKAEITQGSTPTDGADLGMAPYVTPPAPLPLKLRLYTTTLLGPGYYNGGNSGFVTPYTIRIFKRDMQTGTETPAYSHTYTGHSATSSANFDLPNDGSIYSAQIDLPTIDTGVFDAPFRDFSFLLSITPNAGSAAFTAINGFDPTSQSYGTSGHILGSPFKPYAAAYENYRAIIMPVSLGEISFSGPKYHELQSDDLTTTYSAPHWKTTIFGEALYPGAAIDFPAGARNYSIAYTSGSKATIGAKLKLLNTAPTSVHYKIRATSTGGITIPETALTPSQPGELLLAPTPSSTHFPASISKFYDKSNVATAYALNWELQVNNGTWIKLATTYHQLYLTKNDPVIDAAGGSCVTPLGGNLETAFYLACYASNGKTLDDEIVTAIYSEFEDRKVYVVHKITGDPAGVPLNYYGPTSRPEFAGRTGHLLTSGWGVCRGWADFLKQVIGIHGITATTVNITVASGTSASFEAQGANRNPGFFILKPIDIPSGGFTYTATVPPPFYETSLGIPIKIPAQGRSDTQRQWSGHSITHFGGKYMDPSYGSPASIASSGFSAEQQFSFSLAGFRGSAAGETGKDRYWNNDSANLELIFTPAP